SPERTGLVVISSRQRSEKGVPATGGQVLEIAWPTGAIRNRPFLARRRRAAPRRRAGHRASATAHGSALGVVDPAQRLRGVPPPHRPLARAPDAQARL